MLQMAGFPSCSQCIICIKCIFFMLSPDVGCCEQSSNDEGHAFTSGDADFNCLEWINRSGISASICNIMRNFNTVSTFYISILYSHWVFMVGLHGLKYTGSLCLRVLPGRESGSRDPVNERVA